MALGLLTNLPARAAPTPEIVNMIEIHSNATIYTVVPCAQCVPQQGEPDADARGAEYICDDLTQAAVVCEALNLRHGNEGEKKVFCIESSDKKENIIESLTNVKIEPKKVVAYMVAEMGIDESKAKAWMK